MKSEKKLLNNYFSHIYIEKEVLSSPVTEEILKRLPNSKIIEIKHYKDIFSRSRQSFSAQKKSPKLIIAKKENQLIYKGSPMCEDFGNSRFFYTSNIMNCFYDCEYCYLQGMYSSANCVVFVNYEDYFNEVKKLLQEGPMYLCISYDTDILGFEKIVSLTEKWMEFARENPSLKIEIRTKSAGFSYLENKEPSDNIIFAWTLSPKSIIQSFEHGTPPLDLRLKNINMALDAGFPVRLCFDPLLYTESFEDIYGDFIKHVFETVDGKRIFDVSIGVFRTSKDYLKKMRKERPDSLVLYYPYETRGGVSSFKEKIAGEMIDYVYHLVSFYVDKKRIFI